MYTSTYADEFEPRSLASSVTKETAVEKAPVRSVRRTPMLPNMYKSTYVEDYTAKDSAGYRNGPLDGEPLVGGVSCAVPHTSKEAATESDGSRPVPLRMRRAPADPSMYESIYERDYGRVELPQPSEKQRVPPLQVPASEKKPSAKKPSVLRSARSAVHATPRAVVAPNAGSPVCRSADTPAPPASQAPQPAEEKRKTAAGADAAHSRPRQSMNYETEYKVNYRPFSNAPTPSPAPHRAHACVHHISPDFYTTTAQSTYTAPPPAPARAAYTRPTATVRHMDPSMYVSSNKAAYA
ncbi:putative microtubule-associated protein [Leptomonas seymouri]|uniref:Putative microtubule-associated protein n=1 Tax=Leptomonas seymouri TaxID=5684 RepID=A0A0N1PBC1_LEPSE|nr:putative microtubule-associated protein [Leptomonas seymouri]|eukprot:KPI83664.1 putative microtubule-associated protein [Leptomonas seymouri]